jgi:hypothetical protein
MIFEIIGMASVWLLCAVLSFYVPLLISIRLGDRRRTELQGVLMGLWIGAVCFITFVAATILYLAAT